ncbi:MAG: DUF3084 domain-containing protein, partial [Armatimonadetes bacterium]|nr:DUF3084 domain-containing protein [Armatimonadota bacterium]
MVDPGVASCRCASAGGGRRVSHLPEGRARAVFRKGGRPVKVGLILIPVLIVVSGVVAYVGNMVGRAIGRRRLTVLGLRPRHTAHVIAVATGMLITLITLVSVV